MPEVKFKFDHGLGDFSNMCRLIPIYIQHGFNVSVKVDEKRIPVLELSGAHSLNGEQVETHRWYAQSSREIDNDPLVQAYWKGNKCGRNMGLYGLSEKLKPDQLWQQYKKSRIYIQQEQIPIQDSEIVEGTIQDWPKPLVLFHPTGNTNPLEKNFSFAKQKDFLLHLLSGFDGTVLVLDWAKNQKTQQVQNHRIKYLSEELGNIDLLRLAALMRKADLMIGIDSGPFYFSSFTNIPSIGIFFTGIHPGEYMIPWDDALTITMGPKALMLDKSRRFEFQILHSQEPMKHVAANCLRMLQADNQYLPSYCTKAQDVHLQHIVKDMCCGAPRDNTVGVVYDRNRSFDLLFRECKQRLGPNPTFVETGSIRAQEDWAGAGFSTAIFGRYCNLTHGKLISFDSGDSAYKFASQWCKQFGGNVETHCCTGVEGIIKQGKIDVLYLDSADNQDNNLAEFKAAETKLHEKSLVLIDDTPNLTTGLGAKTVEYMQQNGWRILYAGYQVLLSR